MPSDLGGQIEEIAEWVIRVVSGLGFFLPIAIFAVVNLFNRGRKKDQPPPTRPATMRRERPSRPGAPVPAPAPGFPFEPPSWMGMETRKQPSTTQRDDRHRQDSVFGMSDAEKEAGEALRWGSAFDRKEGEPLRWGSAFDQERGKTKWGFDDTEWGSGFGPKRDSEPKITVG